MTSPPQELQSQEQFYSKFKKPKNKDVRQREYLTPSEVDRLLIAAKKSPRHGHRNYCLILLAYRHGLRVGEAINLKWTQVDFKEAALHVSRLKNGKPAVHPLDGVELRALKKLNRDATTPYVFESERGTPLSSSAVRQILVSVAKKADLDCSIHPHMLRHSCGYYLANKGVDTRTIQDYLGHKNISCTVGYTQLSSQRFQGLWED